MRPDLFADNPGAAFVARAESAALGAPFLLL